MAPERMTEQNSMAMPDTTSRWRDWLEEHGNKLLLFARQQTRRAQDAEDVLQEALIKLARKVEEGSFVGGQEAWLPFLYTQIRRESIDLGRRNALVLLHVGAVALSGRRVDRAV